MNEVADKMVMVALHKELHHPMSKVPTPENINYPPGGFRFTFTIDGKMIDGDTPLAIRKRGHQTFLDRAMKKERQGHLLRIAEKTNVTPKILGMRGTLSRVLRHLATSHSQSYYRNKSYKYLHQTYGNVKKVEGKEAQREEDLICPLCNPTQNPSGHKGNINHMHIYCCNKALTKVRKTIYRCVEDKLKVLIEQVEKAAEMSRVNFNIYCQFNDAIRMIGDDDCGVDPSIYEIGPIKRPLPPHTLTLDEWEGKKRVPSEDRLSHNMSNWPLACKLGFITSRTEREWDEEKTTSSADRIHGGALPSTMTKVINLFIQSCRSADNYRDHQGIKNICENILTTWNALEEMGRENTRTMQQAIAAQVQAYHNTLKGAEKKAKMECRVVDEPVLEEEVLEEIYDDQENCDGSNKNETECKGLRCRLNQCNILFRSKGAKLGQGKSKCGECYAFERSVFKMAQEAEDYLIRQLEDDNEDDISEITAGLAGMMEGSQRKLVDRETLYTELVKMDKVNAALGNPTKAKRSKNDKTERYTQPVIRAMTLIATTLGIVPSKPQGHPLPTLTKIEAIEFRKAGGEDLDSWEYHQLRIKHHNTRERIKSALETTNANKKSGREEIILKRLEKGRKLDEKPSSLATGITHRASLNYEAKENKESQENKKKTIAIACKARAMDMQSIAECRKLKALSRRAENSGSPSKKQKGSKGGRIALKNISNTGAIDNRGSDNKTTDEDTMPLMEEEEILKGNESEIIELTDSEDQDTSTQQEGGMIRGMMNLVTLTARDLGTLEKNKLVNDACIDAMGDVLQPTLDVKNISICHTGLWAAVRVYGWGDEAKRLIHPDLDDTVENRWQAYKHTRGNLSSKILLIPCNFPGENKFESGHWILAIREKGVNGTHKLHVLDSLGKESGARYRTIIMNKLIYTPFYRSFPKGKAFDAAKQSENECGARMAKYMENITYCVSTTRTKSNIPKMIGDIIQLEKVKGSHEAIKCRNQIKDRLVGERRKI